MGVQLYYFCANFERACLNSIQENGSINLLVQTLFNSHPSVFITVTKSIMYNFAHVHNYGKRLKLLLISKFLSFLPSFCLFGEIG